MAGIDITGPGAGVALTKDIYVNNSLVGPFDATSDVEVFLEDTGGNPITPTSSVLVGNDLTITANIPNPSGVALQFPNPSQYISARNGDTGWRAQNGWFNYTPPSYPAKFAQLAENLGSGNWYRLKTPLTVGGVTSTERFVDINGVQGWGLAGNANIAVIDKLTGVMFTRSQAGGLQWNATIDNALTYSVVINGLTYSNWYVWSKSEQDAILGTYANGGNWVDPLSSLTITTFPSGTATNVFTGDTNYYIGSGSEAYGIRESNATVLYFTSTPKTFTSQKTIWVHDAKNLIS